MSRNPMITATVLARRSGVSLHTVRHYTRIGLLKPARDASNGYKIYQPSDEIRLRFICAVKDFGFTLAEIAQILEEAQKGNRTCPQVKEIVSRRVSENRRRLKEMKKAQKQMEKALDEWAKTKTGEPDGAAIRRLVESVAEE
jgi:DNA-binding transcriptional MerR regulator